MKKFSQYILAILFVALIFELVIISPSDINEHKEKPRLDSISTPEKVDSDVNQSMANIHVIEARNEAKEWELWADSALGLRTQGELLIKKVKVTFFGADLTFDAIGDSGTVVTESKNIVVDGSVVTTSSNGYIFKTSTVEYNSIGRFLKSDVPVEVIGPKEHGRRSLSISGNSLYADLAQGTVLIEKQVRAKKTIDNGRTMTVMANRVQLSGHSSEVRFSGQVAIEYDGMNISGPDAFFNYDKNTRQLSSIDLTGGVQVKDLSKSATSDKLKLDLEKSEYIFDGHPRMIQGNDEMQGDKIIFLDGGKRVKIQNAKIKVSQDSIDASQSGKKK